jgi:hypothetical protein
MRRQYGYIKRFLKNYTGQEIEAVTLLRLGKIYEKKGDFALALSQYQTIIEKHSDGILDEALYFRQKFSTNSLLKSKALV